MNWKSRLLAFALVLALCCSMLTSCFFAASFGETLLERASEEEETGQVAVRPQEGQEGSFQVLTYTYDLTQEDVDAFMALLAACEQTVASAEDREAVLESIQRTEDAFYALQTQEQLAYIAYCIDGEDELYQNAYSFSSEVGQDAYLKYMEMCQRIYASDDSFGRTVFFEDWSEADVAVMLAYSGEVAELNKANDDILLAYRALEDGEFATKTAELFLQMAENNNRIAKTFGYNNYMEYAYALGYERDYTVEEAEQVRAYIKQYLVPLCQTAVENFLALQENLTLGEMLRMEKLLLRDTNIANESTFHQYIASYPAEFSARMNTLFDGEHAIVISSGNDTAYQGAFTVYLDDYGTPLCYFGNGYQSVWTYAHEMGHFVSAYYSAEASVPLDVAELQSQGNEVLYLSYLLEGDFISDYDRAVANYSLYRFLADIISTAVIDEFELAVYSSADLSSIVPDDLMRQIVESYGGAQWYGEYVGDAVSYWKYVVIESPAYYISYAMSGIAALELLGVAVDNYAAGQQAYQTAVTDAATLGSFKKTLQQMGLSNPFEETAYLEIAALVQKLK